MNYLTISPTGLFLTNDVDLLIISLDETENIFYITLHVNKQLKINALVSPKMEILATVRKEMAL